MATKKSNKSTKSDKTKSTKPKAAAKPVVKTETAAPKTNQACFAGFFARKYEEKESILTHTDDPETAERAIRDSDLIICLDFNAFHRTDRLENALIESSAKKILIDHHLNPDLFSETEVSSASELLFHVLKATPVTEGQITRLDPRARTALMTGMTTDTNNFANSTFPSTLKMASELLEAGVDRDLIVHNLYNRHSENRIPAVFVDAVKGDEGIGPVKGRVFKVAQAAEHGAGLHIVSVNDQVGSKWIHTTV